MHRSPTPFLAPFAAALLPVFAAGLACLVAAAPAAAQQVVRFDVQQAASNWTWSGTTSVGPVVGDPLNSYQLTGWVDLELTYAAGVLTQARIVDADEVVVPDLKGKIPNPIPIFPPLAKLEIVGLRVTQSTPTFNVDAAGNWGATVTTTALAGTLTVTPLAGAITMTDLTGQVSPPIAISGKLTPQGAGLHLDSPQTANFQFTDPGSGIMGQFDLMGVLDAVWTCAAPSIYCSAKTNSLGCVPAIQGSGAPSASAGAGFTVSATQVRNNKPGLLFYSTQGANSAPFQGGTLCVAPPIKRTPAQSAGGNPGGQDCSGQYALDFNAFAAGAAGGNPVPALSEPGTEVWCQWWGRDQGFPAPNNTTLSDGLHFQICP
jgi:hypothetical protein